MMENNDDDKNISKIIKEKAKEFEELGYTYGSKKRDKEKYVFRTNSDIQDYPYFGFILEGSSKSGTYSDICCVVFPGSKEKGKWAISIAVGSEGYVEDYQLAKLPGTRRTLLKIRNDDPEHKVYVKNNFIDLETTMGDFEDNFEDDEILKSTIKKYTKYILACQIMKGFDKKYVEGFIALYAELRKWPGSKTEREKTKISISKISKMQSTNDDENKILSLLEERKYVVIQGAPGTGKTYTAKKIARKITNEEKNCILFTQFHAETTYGDFIYCIKPKINDNEIGYEKSPGVLLNAIEESMKDENKNKKIVLIIDEINRANLSNVLGETFYLFEKKYKDADKNSIEIKVGDKPISELPDNLYVIATMNTADRSLSVVDFALRRRFAWYTIMPHEIESKDGIWFAKDYFEDMSSIFEKYATSEELNIQPGQSYFIINDPGDDAERDTKIKERIRYELLPLIREYLNEGLLSDAKESFESYFRDKINEELYP